jgi:hypothetical protein
MKNILIVDSELRFMNWLGAVLIAADVQPWPACNVPDAITVVGCNPAVPLDLAIVNSSLPGVSDLIAFCRRMEGLKVMALGTESKSALVGIDVWRRKPTSRDDNAKREWAQAIEEISGRQKRAA